MRSGTCLENSLRLRYRTLLAVVLVLSAGAACTSVQPRAAQSSYGCMVAVRSQLPVGLADKRLHCLASAQIAQQCSVAEAWLAGMGKEIADLFDGGDAEWRDWQADRAGVRCRTAATTADIQSCCGKQGF